MGLHLNNGALPGFNGTIKVTGGKELKTKTFDDGILLSQLTNNLRRVGIDTRPPVVTMDEGIVVQPGLIVRHNKDGDTITFSVESGSNKKADYIISRDPGEKPTKLGDPKALFDDAAKYIQKVIDKAHTKYDILSGVDVNDPKEIFSAIHRKTFL
ncbi:MAG: hypothetical protein AB1782_06115 [Cyanobacteriota bacterium]